jgi:hypothetical protein
MLHSMAYPKICRVKEITKLNNVKKDNFTSIKLYWKLKGNIISATKLPWHRKMRAFGSMVEGLH